MKGGGECQDYLTTNYDNITIGKDLINVGVLLVEGAYVVNLKKVKGGEK